MAGSETSGRAGGVRRWLSLVAMVFCVLGGLAALSVGTAVADAAPGDLDTTFGSGGVVSSSTGNPVDVAVQADGKIVAVGKHRACVPSGSEVICHNEFLVERFDADGAPDTSFGGGDGIVTTNFGSGGQATGVVIESGGKILIGGEADGGLALARYNSDGTPDSSLDGDGVVTVAVPNGYGFRSYSSSLALLPNGKIILGGNTYSEAPSEWKEWEPWHMVVARFNADGSLDTSYGTAGATIGPKGNLYGLTVDNGGRALAVGWSNFAFSVARFTANGQLDASFGGGGMASFNFNESGSKADDVLVQPDGKILVSGYGPSMVLVRLGEDGLPDASFGNGDGIEKPSFATPCPIGAAIAIALQPDDRIVFAGQCRTEPNSFKDEWAVARLHPNGSPDKSFSGDGLVTHPFQGSAFEDYASGVALQADGNIVAVGSSGSPEYNFGMMRFLGGGSEPPPGELVPGGGVASLPAATPAPAVPTISQGGRGLKKLTCKRGFRKRRVRGKARCVRVKRRGRTRLNQ